MSSIKTIFILFAFCITCTLSVAQENDSLRIVKPLKYTPRQLIVPGVLTATGLGTTFFLKNQIKYYIHDERNRRIPNFNTSADNYLQYAPIPIAYALDLVGVKSKTDIANRTAILLKGELLMIASTNLLKYTTKEDRPDHSNKLSFPSGHTAQAFAAATFLSEEYRDRYPWMPYVAYSMATATGVLRVAKDKHFVGDVLVGAGLGILSMKISYWTHQYKWGKKRRKVIYQ